MADMLEMIVESVRVSLTNQHRIVVLREKEGDRHLPVWIGVFEAESITLALQGVELARPQTHDLLKNVIRELGGRVASTEIISLHDDVFYSNLVIESIAGTIRIDCRPSDAIAIAIRCRVPIMINKEVLEVAGFRPDQEVDDQPLKPPEGLDFSEGEIQDRLSVFESFLEGLDQDKKTDAPDSDQPDSNQPDSDESDSKTP